MFQNLKGIFSILEKKQLSYFLFIVALCFVGMIFEVCGLGLLIPTLSVVLNPDFHKEYAFLLPVIHFIGNPTQTDLVYYVLSLFLFFFLVKMIYMIWLIYKQSNYAASITDNLAKRLFKGYIHLPYSYHLENNSAILIRNIQTEVQNYTEVIRTLLGLVLEAFISLGIALFLFFWQPIGTLLMASFILLTIVIFNRSTKKKILNWGYQRQQAETKVNQHLMQALGGIKEVKLMGKEDFFLNEFYTHFHKRVFIISKQLSLVQVPRMLLEFLAVVGIVALIYFSLAQNIKLEVLLTTIGVFLAAIFRLLPSLSRIIGGFQVLKFHESVVLLLKAELAMINSIEEPARNGTDLEFHNDLAIRSLSFAYNGSDHLALNGIEISVRRGECIGIIGKSGSGKSTLIDLILGLIMPANGSILVDEANIHDNLRGWQNLVGYVPQNIYLTDATIKENIAFGVPLLDIDDNAIKLAVKSAMLEDFFETLPDRENTIIGERGTRLSGGQRQRIGIARALYHNPQLLVLDEATSALDNKTEQDVMEAVTLLKGSRTIIIVAHRHSTLSKCDQIYEFKSGKIIRSGSPAALMLL